MKIISFSKAIWLTVWLLGMTCVSSVAFADVPLSLYFEFKKSQPSFTDYLTGIGRGVFWANTVLKANNQTPLFCMPNKLALDQGIILSLIDQEVRNPSSGQQWTEDTSIELIMVVAFQKRFPCK